MSKMTVHVIFGQRKCSYPGEYAPEVIDAATQWQLEDNTEWPTTRAKEAEATGDFSTVRVLDLEVDQDQIAKLLNENPKVEVKLSPIETVGRDCSRPE